MATRDVDLALRAALERYAAEDLPALIADARAEACARVRTVLADAMAEALLERARAGVGRGTEASVPEQPSGAGQYVYCVLAAGSEIPGAMTGIDDRAVDLVGDGELAAAVSEVSLADFSEERLKERLSDLEWLERAARAHERVLDQLGARTTLIPMRLCTVYRSEDGVRELLEREAQALGEALSTLAGKAEWGVKVFAIDLPSEDGAAVYDTSGASYMRRRQREQEQRGLVAQRQYVAAIAIHEQLASLASEARTAAPQRPEVSGHAGSMILNGIYLVAEPQRGEFLAAVDELGAEHLGSGLELEPTGPWPAYNFVPGTIGAAW